MTAVPRKLADFDAVFFISLARAVARRKSVQAQIEKHDLQNAVIVDAVDGRQMNCEEARKTGLVVDGKQLERPLHAGEIGCMLSHRSVWEQIVGRGLDTALILEDDAVLSADCHAYSRTLLAEVPGNWDVIYLHSHFKVGSGRGCDPGRKKITGHIYSAYQENGGTAAYALNNRRKAAEYLIERSTPVSYPADGVTNWLSADWDRREWNAYISWPFLVDTPDTTSSIWSHGPTSAGARLRRLMRLLTGRK
jgi:glycosyl transferase family 25